MKLIDYLETVESSVEFARKIERSTAQISHWKTGYRPVPTEVCASIESVTNAQVMRWDLRPNDWWLIWPELQKHKDAPPVPESAHE